ncbi:hypothetical protein HY416_04125 [Candidatus Kaiserbacteria bacterium]|nr:hypothetical protein [Candidatus Kaiserbacteria bacterium]
MKLTICGSIAFYTQMEEIKKTLEGKGHEVKIPELALETPAEFGGSKKVYFGGYIEENGGIDAFPAEHEIWNMKEGAIRDHFEKIDWAEAIVVTNYEKRGVEGYIGGNTLIEIGVAFYTRKPIYILNPISSTLSYKQEILGMKPVMLDGNLDRIPRT